MEHRLGRIDIVAWQERRLRDGLGGPGAMTLAAAAVAAGSGLLLVLRFLGNARVPLELLQTAFALMIASGALVLVRVGVSVVHWLQRR